MQLAVSMHAYRVVRWLTDCLLIAKVRTAEIGFVRRIRAALHSGCSNTKGLRYQDIVVYLV
jgi:hypothetical protein